MDAIAQQKLLRRVEDLATRVEQLEASEGQFIREFEEQFSQLAEINLRILFALNHFKFRKATPTSVLDVNGQPIMDNEEVTLWDIYLQKRDAFAAKVAADVEEAGKARLASGMAHVPDDADGAESDTEGEDGSDTDVGHNGRPH